MIPKNSRTKNYELVPEIFRDIYNQYKDREGKVRVAGGAGLNFTINGIASIDFSEMRVTIAPHGDYSIFVIQGLGNISIMDRFSGEVCLVGPTIDEDISISQSLIKEVEEMTVDAEEQVHLMQPGKVSGWSRRG